MSSRIPLRLPLAPRAGGEAQPVIDDQIAARHPQDGWQLADPLPIGTGSRRRLRGLIEALLPPPPAPRPEGIEERIAQHMLKVLRYFPRIVGTVGFPLLLFVLEWSPLWYRLRPRRLSRLPAAEASALLARLARSRLEPLRLLLLGPKALVLSSYFDQDEVHRALDYDPRPFVAERIALRERLRQGPAFAKGTP
jgi:hypothetical protein